jgi:hypothetical protein
VCEDSLNPWSPGRLFSRSEVFPPISIETVIRNSLRCWWYTRARCKEGKTPNLGKLHVLVFCSTVEGEEFGTLVEATSDLIPPLLNTVRFYSQPG